MNFKIFPNHSERPIIAENDKNKIIIDFVFRFVVNVCVCALWKVS